ncbi:hypothetical protein Cde04nite_32580 [Cellulomonas denverensis]|nr:hypothetical protein Cde04nite_32580 [Cellulomonas denverensis]
MFTHRALYEMAAAVPAQDRVESELGTTPEGVEAAGDVPFAMVLPGDGTPPTFYLPSFIYPKIQANAITVDFDPRGSDGS